MSELRALMDAFDAAGARGERCALATVVSVDGSSYRRPGARMLVHEDGRTVGTISAGCLERDVVEHARRAMRTGVPALVEYETASADNEVAWGLGLGCGGTVRVLVEPDATSCLAAIRRACDDRMDGVADGGLLMATVYERGTRRDVEPGARLLIGAAGERTHERMSDGVAAAVARDVEAFGRTGVAADVRIDDACDDGIGVLVETLLPPVPLVVFGAGPDVVPLVRLARELGWRVEVVDLRAREASVQRFRMADRVTLARPEEFSSHVHVGSRTMAVVMSHDYALDLAALRFLLASPARYVGVMGASHRTGRMLRELGADDLELARLHAPAGLDIGADGPVEIALSIVAEMRAVLGGRGGAMLRDRRGAIHPRPDELLASADRRVG